MNPTAGNNREKRIFEQALELDAGAGRDDFVDRACAGDATLRSRVRELLHAHGAARKFLPAEPESGTHLIQATENVGDRIGRYRLCEKIGEGGCGIVYAAEQEKPVHRRVALKVIKLGMDTREVVARFEAERQALALMDHPNIARVFDAGATGTGRPYFVMEFVHGVRITRFCEEHRLGTVERLKLFIPVCHAIQHAHQKGIIHRDVKPSNILVSLHDDEPIPKVIDFGIAKAFGGRLSNKTPYTHLEEFLGTPAYMSPEQAGRNDQSVDTRCDIYGLGVLLYELLTGSTPFDSKELRKLGLDEMLRTIREKEPVRPSTRLAREPPASRRFTSGKADIDRDLDWIVMKALAKDPRRRYETANALAVDIEHHLRHEPVTVGPPGNFYRFQKFVRRHRTGLAAVGVIVVGLTASLLVALFGLDQARTERNRALAAEQSVKASLQRMNAHRVHELFSRDDSANGLALLASLLRQNPKDQATAEWLLNELTQRSFPLPSLPPLGHDDSVLRGCFSPDGRRILTVSRNNSAQLWDAATGKPGATLRHAPGLIRSGEFLAGLHPLFADFSPNGQQVATASVDNTARIWDSETGQPLTPPLVHPDWVTWVKFSPDGRWVGTACKDGAVRLWNRVTGEPVGRPFQQSGWINCVEFSPDGRFLITASDDGTARIWEVQSGEAVGQPLRHRDSVKFATFSPDGQRAVTVSVDWTGRIWSARTGEPLSPPLKHDYLVASAQFSPDGSLVATASFDGTVRVWDGFNGQPTGKILRHKSVVRSVRFSPDGQRIVTASEDKSARVWDVRTGEPLTEPMRHHDIVWDAEFSPDGSCVITASADKTAQLWDVRPGQAQEQSHLFENKVEFAQWSPDNQRLLTLSGGRCEVGLAETGGGLEKAPLGEQQRVLHAQFSPDGNRLVTASEDKTARVWDARTGRALTRQMKHEGPVLFAEFSPDGRWVVTASADRTARIWNAQTGETSGPPLHHPDAVSAARFNPDGQRLLTISGNVARIWNLAARPPEASSLHHDDRVLSAQFSPDGLRVVTASQDHTARVWDARSAAPLTGALKHDGPVHSAQFSPDGLLVITASADGTARIWDSRSGRPVSQPLAHDAQVICAEFSPDGHHVLTASLDGTARVWDVATGQPICEPLRHRRRINLACFSADGRRVLTSSHDRTARIWRLVHATAPAPEWLPPLAEAVIGGRLNAERLMEDVPAQEFLRLRDRLATVPGTNDFGRWVRWFLADRSTRSISPWSNPCVPEFVESLLRFEVRPYNLTRRLEALKLMPTNGLAYAQLSETLAQEATGSETQRLAAMDWCSQRALALIPAHPAVWKARADFLRRSGNTNAALATLAQGSRFAATDVCFWIRWARLLEEAGQIEDAFEKYTKALTISEIPPYQDPVKFASCRLDFFQRHQGRFQAQLKEASTHLAKLRAIPQRAVDCPRELLDLTPFFNAGLDRSWLSRDFFQLDLHELPHGRARLDGVEFDLRGVAQRSSALLKQANPGFTESSLGLSVRLKCHRLHFLHAADVPEAEGRRIGSYRIHYADGQQQEIPIVYGRDVLAWVLESSPESNGPGAAWRSVKPTGVVQQLNRSTWENPRPDVPIETLDFVSTMTRSAPFLLAITAEP